MRPWADKAPAPVVAQIQLKFTIQSDVAVRKPLLALEDAETIRVQLDGKSLASKVTGWWVDECIKTIALTRLRVDTEMA